MEKIVREKYFFKKSAIGFLSKLKYDTFMIFSNKYNLKSNNVIDFVSTGVGCIPKCSFPLFFKKFFNEKYCAKSTEKKGCVPQFEVNL